MNSSTSTLAPPSPFSPSLSALSTSASTAPSSVGSPIPFPSSPTLARAETCPWEFQGDVGSTQVKSKNPRGLTVDAGSASGAPDGKRLSRFRSSFSLRGRAESGGAAKARVPMPLPSASAGSLWSVGRGGSVGDLDTSQVQGKAARLLGLPDGLSLPGTPPPPGTPSLLPKRASILSLTASVASAATATTAGSQKSVLPLFHAAPQPQPSPAWHHVALTPEQYSAHLDFHLMSDPAALHASYPSSLPLPPARVAAFFPSPLPSPTDLCDSTGASLALSWVAVPQARQHVAAHLGQATAIDFGVDPDLALDEPDPNPYLDFSAASDVAGPVTELSLAEFLGFSPAIAAAQAYVFGYTAFDAALRKHAEEARLFDAVETLAWRKTSKRVAPRLAGYFI